MIAIRPIRQDDCQAISEFPLDSLLGMTNLPRDIEKLREKIRRSEKSFRKKVDQPGDEEYYFVLEDFSQNQIGGTCGILADSTQSFEFIYQIEHLNRSSGHLPTPKELKILKVAHNPADSSEVCALYLQRSFRKSGLGRLLALSRFLFMAAFPERFKRRTVAELRGYLDEQKTSPFWNAIGCHFCSLSFAEIMEQFHQLHDFIPEILPEYPLYIPLMPKEAQEVIGKTHDSTRPAYQMLIDENFTWNQEVDVIEGGPILSCRTQEIRSFQESRLVQAEIASESLDPSHEFVIANEKLDFRACLAPIQLREGGKGAISEETAYTLEINDGDVIRYSSVHHSFLS